MFNENKCCNNLAGYRSTHLYYFIAHKTTAEINKTKHLFYFTLLYFILFILFLLFYFVLLYYIIFYDILFHFIAPKTTPLLPTICILC